MICISYNGKERDNMTLTLINDLKSRKIAEIEVPKLAEAVWLINVSGAELVLIYMDMEDIYIEDPFCIYDIWKETPHAESKLIYAPRYGMNAIPFLEIMLSIDPLNARRSSP